MNIIYVMPKSTRGFYQCDDLILWTIFLTLWFLHHDLNLILATALARSPVDRAYTHNHLCLMNPFFGRNWLCCRCVYLSWNKQFKVITRIKAPHLTKKESKKSKCKNAKKKKPSRKILHFKFQYMSIMFHYLSKIFTGILLRGATNSSNPHGPDWTIDCFLIELSMRRPHRNSFIKKFDWKVYVWFNKR